MTRLTRKTTDEDYEEYRKEMVGTFEEEIMEIKEEWLEKTPYLWNKENEENGFIKNVQQCLLKLGKLEDIEEELGCPLDVVFKALKNGIYIWNGKDYLSFKVELFYHTKLNKWGWVDTACELKDYGVTWWLDKKEVQE